MIEAHYGYTTGVNGPNIREILEHSPNIRKGIIFLVNDIISAVAGGPMWRTVGVFCLVGQLLLVGHSTLLPGGSAPLHCLVGQLHLVGHYTPLLGGSAL